MNGEPTERIVCRVKKARDYYDRRESADIYGEEGIAGDGTFDRHSLICDACYIAIGLPVVSAGGDPATLAGGWAGTGSATSRPAIHHARPRA
jgi:hypothetical protein